MQPTVRDATGADLQAINNIYNACIVDKHTSFDTEPWTMEERAAWFARYRPPSQYELVVLEVGGDVAGFASSSPFRSKAAYDSSVETTVVLDESVVGRGFGRPLLETVVNRLKSRPDLHRAYALIALPNEPSIRLHLELGYRTVGVLDEVGYKLGRFHSVQLMELAL
jgi:phosphinothricin acetyltransferase